MCTNTRESDLNTVFEVNGRPWGLGHRQSHHIDSSIFIASILIFTRICTKG